MEIDRGIAIFNRAGWIVDGDWLKLRLASARMDGAAWAARWVVMGKARYKDFQRLLVELMQVHRRATVG